VIEIGLSIEWEEMDPGGEVCTGCDQLITGTMYVMMIQVGGPEQATPVGYYCKACQFGDTEGTKSGG
jgi:hypothetical protein